jgi:hypothetical protein
LIFEVVVNTQSDHQRIIPFIIDAALFNCYIAAFDTFPARWRVITQAPYLPLSEAENYPIYNL